jgi:hypothetical protein
MPWSNPKQTITSFNSARMDWMVAPSFPAFAAAFPDSTGMVAFNKNRIASLLRAIAR